MSTDKQFRASSKHDEVLAALLSTEDASLSQSTLSNSPRQADEPPSEATTSPNASPPDSKSKTAGALTGMVPPITLSLPVRAVIALTRREDTAEQENQTDGDSGTAETEGNAESDRPNTRDTSDGDETTREGTAEMAKVFGEEWMRAWKTLQQERPKWITAMEMEPGDMREGTVELAKVLGAKWMAAWMVAWKTPHQERLKKRTKLEPEDTETEASESETSESTTSESETSETETSDTETAEAETTESETADMATSETELAERETTKKAQQKSKLPETELSNKRKDAKHMTKQENTMNKRQKLRNTRDIEKTGHTRGNTRDIDGRKRKRRKTTDKDDAHRKTEDIDETEIENTEKTERRHKKKTKEGIG